MKKLLTSFAVISIVLHTLGCPGPEIPASFFGDNTLYPDTANSEGGPDSESNTTNDGAIAEDVEAISGQNDADETVESKDVAAGPGDIEAEQDGLEAEQDGLEAEEDTSTTEGCQTSEDCPAEESNSCVQVDCIDGFCVEASINEGESCAGDIPEVMDSDCAETVCQDGSCLVKLADAGTGCGPMDPGICAEYLCSDGGVCEKNSKNEGVQCQAEVDCRFAKCESGECVVEPVLCEDGVGCTLDQCREIACADESSDFCTYSLQVNDPEAPENVVTLSGAINCKTTGPEGYFAKAMTGSCAGRCGESDAPTCFCDQACFEYADCCEDVCAQCGELGECENAPRVCSVEICDPAVADLVDATSEGCIVRTFSEEDVLSSALSEGMACVNDASLSLCDDQNSCTDDICDPSSLGSGCSHTPKNVGDECSGKELCYPDGATCVETSDGDGSLECAAPSGGIGPFPLDQCASQEHCVNKFCNEKTGSCEYVMAVNEQGDPPSCSLVNLSGIGYSEDPGNTCGIGVCSACPEGDPACNIAHCIPDTTLGLSCSPGAGNACSAYGNSGDALCVEAVMTGGYECRLPCGSFSSTCLDCFHEPGSDCYEDFRSTIAHPQRMGGLCQAVFGGPDNAEKFLASVEWENAIVNCIPEILPAHLTSLDMKNSKLHPEFVSKLRGLLGPCIEEYIAKNAFYLSKSTEMKENLRLCAANAVSSILYYGNLAPCEEPTDNCAGLGFATGMGAPICGDAPNVPFAYFGTYDYQAPFCIHSCSEAEGPFNSICGSGICLELEQSGPF